MCLSAAIIFSFMLLSVSFAQEIPAPGTTIDKNNYKKYAHLFPAEFLQIWEDGFQESFMPPVMHVVATQNYPMPKTMIALTEKNAGKFGINAKGEVTGGWNRMGLPFSKPDQSDKDFLYKLMWNYDARYGGDDYADSGFSYSLTKRPGQPVRYNSANGPNIFFTNRIVIAPKPFYETPTKLFKAGIMHFLYPESARDITLLNYRFLDPAKPDEGFTYLPSMRRVLRGDSSQRSTPVVGSTQAADDFGGFDGRIPEFTYSLVGSQKVLTSMQPDLKALEKHVKDNSPRLFYPGEKVQVRDTWVIDVKSKDPKYPQSKKRIWLDKEANSVIYALAWDKAGKLWKVWSINYTAFPLDGGYFFGKAPQLGVDIQFRMATLYGPVTMTYNTGFTYEDVTPAALPKLATR